MFRCVQFNFFFLLLFLERKKQTPRVLPTLIYTSHSGFSLWSKTSSTVADWRGEARPSCTRRARPTNRERRADAGARSTLSISSFQKRALGNARRPPPEKAVAVGRVLGMLSGLAHARRPTAGIEYHVSSKTRILFEDDREGPTRASARSPW